MAEAKKRVVHLGTQIVSVFGVLDESGNVIERKKAEPSTNVFSAEEFQRIFESLDAGRQQLIEGVMPDGGD